MRHNANVYAVGLRYIFPYTVYVFGDCGIIAT